MTYRQLNHLTSYLSQKYLDILKKDRIEPQDKQYCEMIDLCLAVLSIESQLILRNDFFFLSANIVLCDYEQKNVNKRQLIYSESTYYRKKRRAMDEFINCLHNQKMI